MRFFGLLECHFFECLEKNAAWSRTPAWELQWVITEDDSTPGPWGARGRSASKSMRPTTALYGGGGIKQNEVLPLECGMCQAYAAVVRKELYCVVDLCTA